MNKARDKKKIQDVLLDGNFSVKNLSKVEEKLENIFQIPFICFEKSTQGISIFFLFFEVAGELMQIYYYLYPGWGEEFFACIVSLEEEGIIQRLKPSGSDEESTNRKNAVLSVSKKYIDALKEDNSIRLLEVTGSIEFNAELRSVI